jgi:hypothetical protein
MKQLIDTCIDYFKTDESRRYLKDVIVQPVGNIIYNEIYVYLWLICLYHVFLIFIILANLFLLLRIISWNHKSTDT